MTQSKIITIDGGSAEYWRMRKQGFWLIREAELAAKRLETAPTYIAGAWDEDYGDYEPVENLAPFIVMEDAVRAIEADETAVSILVAQRRTRIGKYQIDVVIRQMELDEGHVEDPVSNPLWAPDTD